MPNPIPLHDENPCSVWARVAFRLIFYDYRRNPDRYKNPSEGMTDLCVDLSGQGWAILSSWVAAYAREYKRAKHYTLAQCRDTFIERSMVPGISWRYVAFPEYKATRRYR